MSSKTIRYFSEAAVLWLVLGFFKLLPVDAASAVGGWLGRKIGYQLKVTRYARRNLSVAFPEWTQKQIEAVLVEMWDNLGRVAGEYPHIGKFSFGPGKRVEIENIQYLHLLRDDHSPGMFFSAHLGNWELLGAASVACGLPLTVIYRAPNNPFVHRVFLKFRSHDKMTLLPKGPQGARQALLAMRQGGHLGMLVDQKMNDGISVPFFGRPAMTAPALAAMAMKFKCPIVPAQVIRLKGARYRVILHPPMTYSVTGNPSLDQAAIMAEVNRMIEGWVRKNPAQWMWIHKRWPD